MEYNDLSEEAKEVLKGMVEHCLNRCLCMGMDEGVNYNDEPHEFRRQLELFVKTDN